MTEIEGFYIKVNCDEHGKKILDVLTKMGYPFLFAGDMELMNIEYISLESWSGSLNTTAKIGIIVYDWTPVGVLEQLEEFTFKDLLSHGGKKIRLK